ncbi:MAG: methionyl-tRNA formyltransferase [Firmicutes bacterium]|nr:methionyl-tRNA formyltransferase [Bacillota bacterium]
MKIVFLGTPEFALPSLKELIKSHHEILAVISQKDKALDRKGNSIETAVKKLAKEHNLKIFQFDNVSKEGIDEIKRLAPDIMITVAFGQMLSKEFLNIAPHGVINVHASLLPKYRGASPIQSAILNGDFKTGVTTMQTVLKMDAGDILKQKETKIDWSTTSHSLSQILAQLGAEALIETLSDIENGTLIRIPQDEEKATYTQKITKEDGLIDFSKTAFEVARKVQALRAYTFLNGKMLKIHSCDEYEFDLPLKSGQVAATCDTMLIGCSDETINVKALQLEGKKAMHIKDFLNGSLIKSGDILGGRS